MINIIECCIFFRDVKFLSDCVGPVVEKACENPSPGII